MKTVLPTQYQIVMERQYRAERPFGFILQASTNHIEPEDALTDFYKKSISMIDEARKKVRAQYPHLYGV